MVYISPPTNVILFLKCNHHANSQQLETPKCSFIQSTLQKLPPVALYLTSNQSHQSPPGPFINQQPFSLEIN